MDDWLYYNDIYIIIINIDLNSYNYNIICNDFKNNKVIIKIIKRKKVKKKEKE